VSVSTAGAEANGGSECATIADSGAAVAFQSNVDNLVPGDTGADLPNVTIQVIHFAVGWHPALYGMFNVFRFPTPNLPTSSTARD